MEPFAFCLIVLYYTCVAALFFKVVSKFGPTNFFRVDFFLLIFGDLKQHATNSRSLSISLVGYALSY